MGQMCSHTPTETHTHTHSHRLTQTNRKIHTCSTHIQSHMSRHTQIITIITLAHAQAIIYSNIQLHMQEGTPGQDLSVAQLLNGTQTYTYTQRRMFIYVQQTFDFCLNLKLAHTFYLSATLSQKGSEKHQTLSVLTGFEFLCWTHK